MQANAWNASQRRLKQLIRNLTAQVVHLQQQMVKNKMASSKELAAERKKNKQQQSQQNVLLHLQQSKLDSQNEKQAQLQQQQSKQNVLLHLQQEKLDGQQSTIQGQQSEMAKQSEKQMQIQMQLEQSQQQGQGPPQLPTSAWSEPAPSIEKRHQAARDASYTDLRANSVKAYDRLYEADKEDLKAEQMAHKNAPLLQASKSDANVMAVAKAAAEERNALGNDLDRAAATAQERSMMMVNETLKEINKEIGNKDEGDEVDTSGFKLSAEGEAAHP